MDPNAAPTPTASDPYAEMVQALRQLLQPAQPPAVSTPSMTASTPIARPQYYSGEPEGCSGFLLQCSLFIEANSQSFPNDIAKIAFVMSLLTGRALQWAEALWNGKSAVLASLDTFFTHFREVFGVALAPLSVHDELLKLKQANNNIHDYMLRFRALAASSLQPAIHRQMAIYEDTVSLESFIKKAVHISQHLSACAPDTLFPHFYSPVNTASPEGENEPMITDTYRLSPSERTRRMQNHLCLYCGEPNHIIRNCPVRPQRPTVSTVRLTPSVSNIPHIPADLVFNSRLFPVHVLVDSGAAGNLISSQCLTDFKIPDVASETLIGVLGKSWEPTPKVLTVQSTSVESPETTSSVIIPSEYASYADVFSARLPQGKIYPLSIPEREAMENYINEALKQGFIRPSTSPAASSFFFVDKKDGGLRPCIDYRVLNESTVKFAYPLPLVPAALEELREAHVFTKLDLRSAYNLIRIHEGDEWKTAFITPSGHYEYLVMPYGLANSPSVFLNFMNEIFRNFLHHFVIVYIDDILIYSCDLQEHRKHVRQVLQRLREHQLFLKLEKCEFHQSSVSFLGYVISGDGVRMEQNKVSQWTEPLTIKDLQRFLGFANFYCRFVKNFSILTTPLTALLKVLQHPDPDKPFVVEVDAADTGVGAVLSQWSGEPLALHPCAYYSKKLTPAEQNYGIGDRELLAIKLALEEWRHWLEGAKHPFQVITDHKNLQYLQNAKRLNARQARWSMFFTRFRFHITYQSGHKNIKADALSRMHSSDPVDESSEPILPPSIFLAPIVWQLDDQIRHPTLEEPALPGGPAGSTYVPTSLRLPLLDSAHTSPGSGHPGSRRTLSLLRDPYWWPNMATEVTRYVRGCSVCAITTTPRRLPEGKLQPLPIPRRPWTHIGVDFATDLPPSNGYTTILVVVDRFSKACKLIPLKGLPTALETAEALFQNVFRNFGLPEDIVSDRYQPSLFPWSGEASEVPAVDPWFQESERVWDSAHVHLQRAVRRHTENANVRRLPTPTYHPGDKVWLSTRDIHLRLLCKKLSPRYIGPYNIHSQISYLTQLLNLHPQYRISSSFHVSLLKPYIDPVLPPSTEPEPPPPPPQPEIIGDQIYRIQEILQSRCRGGRLQYLIDWENYGPEERSWVDRDDILDPALLAEFHQQHPEQPAPRGRGRPRKRSGVPGGTRGGGSSVTSPTRSLSQSTREHSPEY
ncbi:hypothetical protein M9458_053324 [Cirrhinus mrigala]|uniref:Gypsy retrotransposon integrase-like protein 1 n=1 Tax=Cirrhinus mrigala TaxID=683832 RepID=A0ABD0MNZ9_CIRMR